GDALRNPPSLHPTSRSAIVAPRLRIWLRATGQNVYVAVTFGNTVGVLLPLMKDGRLCGKSSFTTASSISVPTLTPAPMFIWNGESFSLTVPGRPVTLASRHAALLAPNRSVSQLFTCDSSAANSCGEIVSVILVGVAPNAVKMSAPGACLAVLPANAAPSTNRSFVPSVQLPAA